MRAKAAVSRQYWALDEKSVAWVARSSSVKMRDATSLCVGRTEEIRSKHYTSRWTRSTSLQFVCEITDISGLSSSGIGLCDNLVETDHSFYIRTIKYELRA